MRFLLLIILSCFSFLQIFAQADDTRKEINKIKKSSHYIYAESTAPTEADAKKYAEDKLYDAINKWVITKKKGETGASLVISNKKELWTTLSMPRGSNMYRAFIYVKKNDIIQADNAVVIENKSVPAVKKGLEKTLPDQIKTLAECEEYADMVKIVKNLKATGKIKTYARYASLENPDKCYLIIYNKSAKIVAILSPGAERVNIKTNEIVSLKNYSGCGAIGIEL